MTEQQQPRADAHSNVPRTVLQEEQARLLYAGIPVSLAVNALIASILVATQRTMLTTESIIVWCTLFGATLVLRAFFTVSYRHAQRDELASETWLTRFRIGTATTGIAWGLTSFLLFPANDIPHQSFLIFAIAGMTAGAVTSLSIDLVSSLAFIIPALVPLIARLLTEGEEIPVAMGAMGTLYLVALILNARRTYIGICENIHLRLEAVKRENNLRASEAQFLKAQEVAQMGSWNLGIPHKNIIWSHQVYRILGISPDTPLSYETFLGFVHPDDRGKVDAAWNAALRGTPYDIEHRIVVGGHTHWIREIAEVQLDSEGRPLTVIGTVQDITEHKQMEHEILRINAGLEDRVRERTKELEQTQVETSALLYRYKTLMQASMEGIHIMDMQGNIVEANDAFCDMLGYTQEEVAGLNVADWEAQHSAGELREGFKALIGKSAKFESLHRRKDGTLINVEVSVNGVEMEGLGLLFATCRDITMRKRVEAEILAANSQLHATMDAIPDLLFEVGMDGRYYSYHAHSNDLLAAPPEMFLGKTIYEVLPPDAVKIYMSALQEASQQGRSTGKEIVLPLPQGERWFELSVASKRESEGQDRRFIVLSRDITARKQDEKEIHNLAFFDALTRLPNRRLLLDRFHLALSMSARSHHYGAVLFLDMDKFKTLNDTLGHDYGDLMLVEVAQRIQACVREVDTVARLGGDEFVVLFEEVDTSAEHALQKVALITEKIRASLTVPYQLKEHEHHSSPSIGVCLYRGNEESVDTLLKHADMAMYQAKDSGRNTVRFFDPAMQHAMETHAALEADLRHAVSDKQLILYYQIQLDNDHRPLGAEALVRWVHPKRGMVSPAQFIPIAEESSLILDIGHWVLEKVCRQLKEWSKHEQTRHLELAVNVSAQQFRLQSFVDTVASLIHIHQVNPACLKLELTESVVLTDVSDVVTKMHALKTLGIKLSMDDFGTGYSSLSCLKKLPLDQIKIDRSFNRVSATDPNDAVMVQTIINLAQNFSLNVIAEGVETEAQLDFLKLHGCMAYQGYLFSKPVPIEDFEGLLKQGSY